MERRGFLRRCVGAAIGAATMGLLPTKADAKSQAILDIEGPAPVLNDKPIVIDGWGYDDLKIDSPNLPAVGRIVVPEDVIRHDPVQINGCYDLVVQFPEDKIREIIRGAYLKSWSVDVDDTTKEVTINVRLAQLPDYMSDIYLSPKELDDIRKWGVDQIDEVTRREIMNSGHVSTTVEVD